MQHTDAKAGIANARISFRTSAWLLLAGQLLYIGVTQLHVGGDGNNHPVIFAAYAANDMWTAVHLGQFAAMAMILSGLLGVFATLDRRAGGATFLCRAGAAMTAAALALYGALQAVDGVALKQAVDAWAMAPAAEKTIRFANAETVRWIEWGMRSYADFAIGLALLLCAASMMRTASIPRAIALVVALSGLAYLAQGWIAGTQGFSPTQASAIVAGWGLSIVWMLWLAATARRLDSAA